VTSSATPADSPTRPDGAVSIEFPADSSYLGLLRAIAAGMSARLDFSLDRLEDVRLAVNEAVAVQLALADRSKPARCVFSELGGGGIEIQVSVYPRELKLPSQGSFAWTVLAALADEVAIGFTADQASCLTLSLRREQPVAR
jgi:serine/threonine-protein kinase RsbW